MIYNRMSKKTTEKSDKTGRRLQIVFIVAAFAVVAYFSHRHDERLEQTNAEVARTVPRRLDPLAKDVMARACNMLDWIDHQQQKRGEPLPASLILSDGRAPWEPLAQFEEILADIDSKLGGSQQMEILVAHDRVSSLRTAGQALHASATDLLTAEIAIESGRPATANSKFEAARKSAQHAVYRAEEAIEPLPTVPILEGGPAVIMAAKNSCGAL